MSQAIDVAVPDIPYAGRTVIALAPGTFAEIVRTVSLVHRIAHSPAWAAEVDRDADAALRFAPGNFGVMMGYDFHLGPDGPRLIEINTNAGGALLNGLHTASLCEPARLACLCRDLMPMEAMRDRIVRTFEAELRAVRGDDARLSSVAIVEDRPDEQFLRAEFDLFRLAFEAGGVRAVIADTRDLVRGSDGRVRAGDLAIDLVYLRDTDFRLATDRAALLRAAYLDGAVVVTPSPREWHLVAHKQRLALLSSAEALHRLGVAEDDAAFLRRIVPETLPLESLGAERAWRERKDWVFKPENAYGSKAVYRGDKISRRRFDEVMAAGGFVAQRRVEPGEVEVTTDRGPARMKFDVRAYAYREQVLLLGARVYEGQVTNLRTPGGGFSAICVVRDAA